MVITEDNICVTPQDVQEVLTDKNIQISDKKLMELTPDCLEDLFRGLEKKVYEQWSEEERTALLCMGAFSPFEVEMAEQICENKSINIILEQLREKENGIRKAEGKYTIHPVMMKFLIWKREKEYSLEEIGEIYNKAGQYYEASGKLLDALECYHCCKNTGKIKEILIKNSKRHPGTGFYYQMRKYYLALDEKEIENSPVMMAAMCMLHAMLFQKEKSEYWYEKLTVYSKKHKAGSPERKEAVARLTYLNIASPYSENAKILDFITYAGGMLSKKEITLSEFSVTSNMPSIMNGGKDFCEWSKRDRALMKNYGMIVEFVLGKMGVGLPDIALAESLFEKGGDFREIEELLNKGRFRAECNGRMELCFAAVGVMVRLYAAEGRLPFAKQLLESFKEKVRQEGEEQLLLNIEALQCRLLLLNPENTDLEEWEAKLPNPEVEFVSLERYRYLTKIRVYIATEKYENALFILERMEFLAREYDRVYILIEVFLLRAICLFRMGDERYKECIQYAVKRAEEYSFIRVIAEEGVAVLPILKEMKAEGISGEYRQKLLATTSKMAELYPDYLQFTKVVVKLTEAEKNVLELLCKGITAAEIAKQLHVSEATVRFHCKNIYKKLGARGKVEAVNIAREHKII